MRKSLFVHFEWGYVHFTSCIFDNNIWEFQLILNFFIFVAVHFRSIRVATVQNKARLSFLHCWHLLPVKASIMLHRRIINAKSNNKQINPFDLQQNIYIYQIEYIIIFHYTWQLIPINMRQKSIESKLISEHDQSRISKATTSNKNKYNLIRKNDKSLDQSVQPSISHHQSYPNQTNIFLQSINPVDMNLLLQEKDKKYRVIGFNECEEYNKKIKKMKDSWMHNKRSGFMRLNDSRFFHSRPIKNQNLQKMSQQPIDKLQSTIRQAIQANKLISNLKQQKTEFIENKINMINKKHRKYCDTWRRIAQSTQRKHCYGRTMRETNKKIEDLLYDETIDKHRKNMEILSKRSLTEQKQNIQPALWQSNLRCSQNLRQLFNQSQVQEIKRGLNKLKVKGQNKKYKQLNSVNFNSSIQITRGTNQENEKPISSQDNPKDLKSTLLQYYELQYSAIKSKSNKLSNTYQIV